MLSISAVLALFTLLVLSTAVFFIAKRFTIPYTVLLVLVGLLIVPLVQLPYLSEVFGFLDDMVLTPELLFYIFLPILIFESAFNMNVRKMIDSSWAILSLAIVGLLISTVLIATALYFVLPLIGFDIPFIVALLFGAIISSTDPVAVLALFKEYGAPKRLTMIFEGESLFNDGTAVALFMVILAVATEGFHGTGTVVEGIAMFIGMVVFGVLLGLGMAIIFSRALRYTKSNEFVTVTLLIISAHITFILGELVNHYGLFGLHIHISSIIATTIAALFLGNYARHTLRPKTDTYLSKFIEHTAFMANSLVFVLAGLLFASSNIDIRSLWLPILVTVLIVALARAISVYAVVLPLNKLKVETLLPSSWQLLLAWGSLRGALAIIVVLLVPDDFTVAGWQYDYTPKEFLLAVTIGCILATLFIKAPLIGTIMRRLSVDKADPLEEAREADLAVYYLMTEQAKLENHKTRGFVRDEQYKLLKQQVTDKVEEAVLHRNMLVKEHGKGLFEQALHMVAINIESYALKQLYVNGELSERVFRKITGKLRLQTEKIEMAQHEEIDPEMHIDRKDVFDRLVNFAHRLIDRKSGETNIEEKLQYYRAQMIMARKAVKIIKDIQSEHQKTEVFLPVSYDKVIARYETYRTQCAAKLDGLLEKHDTELAAYLSYLAQKSLTASGNQALDFLHSKGIVSEEVGEAISHRW